ncbi:DNA replication/repair protein RecF [Amedibacillus sp. YH-ame6]
MILKNIRLHNYRNYENLDLSFQEGIHILSGKNAQGKTNILESILYLSTTRSHRTNDDEDLIKEGCDAFFLRATIEKQGRKKELQITVNDKGKNLFLFKNPVNRVSDFIGEFNAVMFCPDDMTLFNASPRVRRRFIDMELSKVSKKYMNTLFIAQKLLKERNACLKSESVNREYLDVLTDQIVESQIIVMKQRYFFLQQLVEKSQTFYERLSSDHTKISVQYESCVPFYEDEELWKNELKEKYKKSLDRDMFLKQTTVGIHKEDYVFKMNDKEVATYASQGQKRSILLALKIGMIYMIKDIIGEYPVLLLDDVFSELDSYRRKELLYSLPQIVQIFISTTDIEEFVNIDTDRKVSIWNVEDGIIKEM